MSHLSQGRPKVPIFIRRQLPKQISSRLSAEELQAAVSQADKLEVPEPPSGPPEVSVERVERIAPTKTTVATRAAKSKALTATKPVAAAKAAALEPAVSSAAQEPAPLEPVEPAAVESAGGTPAEQPPTEDSDLPAVPPPTERRKRPRRGRLPVARLAAPLRTTKRLVVRPSLDSWLLLACLLLLVATQLTLIWFGRTGLVATMVAVLLLTFVALFREPLRKVAISLAIIPVAQMAASTIITHNAFQTATVFYALILLLALTYRYLFTLDEPVAASRLKWTGHFYGLPLMLIVGQLLGLVGYGLLRHHYDFQYISLPLVFVAAIVFAFAEEMLLRGLIQQQAARLTNPVLAVIIPSGLYAVLTISHGTLLSVIPAVVTGVTLSLVYHFKHNLVLTTAVNAASKLAYLGLVATFILR